MKFAPITAAALGLAVGATASPVLLKRQDNGDSSSSSPSGGSGNNNSSGQTQNITDVQILQYALTLEHLEAAFYNQSLSQFGTDAFSQAGFNASVRNQIYSIGRDEAAHVDFLTTALGDDAVVPCTYDFSAVTDVPSFLATAQVLEGVGVSAYLGAARNISTSLVGAAGSILTVEARHASYIHSQVDQEGNVIPSPFDTPLDFNQVYSLAAPFLASCPQNQSLPFTAFPAATLTPVNPSETSASGGLSPGAQVTVTYQNASSNATGSAANSSSSNGSEQTYLAIIQGVTPPVFLPFSQDQPVTLPSNLTGGQTYAIVTSSDSEVTDDTTIAGPAVVFIDVPLPEAPEATATASSSSTSTASASNGAGAAPAPFPTSADGASSASYGGASSTDSYEGASSTDDAYGSATMTSSYGTASAPTASSTDSVDLAQQSAQSAATASAASLTGSAANAAPTA